MNICPFGNRPCTDCGRCREDTPDPAKCDRCGIEFGSEHITPVRTEYMTELVCVACIEMKREGGRVA